MARNAPDPSRRSSSRVTKAPVHRAAPTRRDRRQFWIKFVAGFLVLMMLLPVIAFLFS